MKKILFTVLLAATPLVVFASQGTGTEQATRDTSTKTSTSHHVRHHRKHAKSGHHVKRHRASKQRSQTQ